MGEKMAIKTCQKVNETLDARARALEANSVAENRKIKSISKFRTEELSFSESDLRKSHSNLSVRLMVRFSPCYRMAKTKSALPRSRGYRIDVYSTQSESDGHPIIGHYVIGRHA